MTRSARSVATAAPAGKVGRRIMVIYGTRPEAVKVAPLIRALAQSPVFTPMVAVTAQHRSMLDQVNDVFDIKPEFDLDIHRPGQTLTAITTRALHGVQAVLAEQRPDAVVRAGPAQRVAEVGQRHLVPGDHSRYRAGRALLSDPAGQVEVQDQRRGPLPG